MRLVFRFVECILKAAENTFESQVHPENTMKRAVCTEINRELTEKYDLINQLHRSSNKSSTHIPYPDPKWSQREAAVKWPSFDAFKQLEKNKEKDPGSANVARLVLSMLDTVWGTLLENEYVCVWMWMCMYIIWFTHLWPKCWNVYYINLNDGQQTGTRVPPINLI